MPTIEEQNALLGTSVVPVNGYATHQRLLIKAALATTGPILELGSGWYSTPLLHEIARHQNRQLLTVDTDEAWLDQFRFMEGEFLSGASGKHSFMSYKQYALGRDITCDLMYDPQDYFGLVFLDHAPGPQRCVDMLALAHCTDLFVCHDVEQEGYDWHLCLPQFEIIEYDRTLSPYTAIFKGHYDRGTSRPVALNPQPSMFKVETTP